MFWKTSARLMPAETSDRAMSSAALSTSLREKKMALGLPVVPLEVCSRTASVRSTASKPLG